MTVRWLIQIKQQYYLAKLSSRILLDKMEPDDRSCFAFFFGIGAASSLNSEIVGAEYIL